MDFHAHQVDQTKKTSDKKQMGMSNLVKKHRRGKTDDREKVNQNFLYDNLSQMKD